MDGIRFLLKHAKSYIRPLVITVVSMLLMVGVQLLAPWIIRTMIATVTNPGSGVISGQATTDRITQLALLTLLIYLARGALWFLRSYMSHVAGWGVVADVRQQIYEHLQQLSLRFYENKQTGQLMSRMVNDSEMLERLIAHAIPDVLRMPSR